jgi:acetylornithine deacetylase/succinyl-diaminopimelate desuccinylase-like protein
MKNAAFVSSRLISFFKDYVELDTSLNSGENYPKAMELIDGVIRNFGFRTEGVNIPYKVAGGRNRVNLIARRYFSKDLPTILIYNHVDVVPARYRHAFKFSMKEGKAYGRGASDMKGVTVGVLEALEFLRDKNLRFNVIFLATTDEETGQLEQLRFLAPKLKLPKNAIIFDPDTFAGGITVAHLGVFKMIVNVKGKSAHSGMSNLGKNAVEDAAKVIGFFTDVKREYEAEKSKFSTFKSVGVNFVCSRCNVNQIEGGTAFNVVPDRCSLTVDCRYIPEADVVAEKEKLLKRLEDFCRREKIKYDVSDTQLIEGYATEHSEAEKLDEMNKELTGESGLYGVMGSTDVSHWAKELKLPHFGIGAIRADNNIHGVGEFIYLKDIENLSKVLVEFLRKR